MLNALKVRLLVLALGLFLTVAAHAATITVTEGGVNRDGAPTANGVVTLREAIVSINNGADINADVTANRVGAYGASDTINFNYPGGGVISLTNAQGGLTITKTIAIMGFTELGGTANSAATGDNSNHTVLISGFNLSGGTSCLTISGQASSGTVVRGVVFDQCPASGIAITNSKNNVIAGDFFGTDSAGNLSAGAGNGTGITIAANAGTDDISGNQIGGPNPADHNVISGNINIGIMIGNSGGVTAVTTGISVRNCYIGMNAAGTATAAFNTQEGIFVQDVTGVTIGGASGSLGGSCSGVCNLISGCANGFGIVVQGSTPTSTSGTLIQGNFVGTDVTGTLARPNGQNADIDVPQSAAITIGGTAAGTGNLISGEPVQGTGIEIDGLAIGPVNIQGNFIGTTTSGNAVLGNGGPGIHIVGATNVNIGGTTASARNVIGGNGNGTSPKGPGILVEGNPPFSTGTAVIQGNNIGIGANGSSNIGNSGNGIDFQFSATGSTVGATTSGGLGGNIIANNGSGRTNGAGVGVANFSSARILSNSIFSNTGSSTGIGIDLSVSGTSDGPTANDACDGDTGGNNLQNFPVLTSAPSTGSSITIVGTLNSTANTTFTIEFFANFAGSQGKDFLGSTTATTNGACNAAINATLAKTVSASEAITATATDPSGNTSELSAFILSTAVITATDSAITGHITDGNGNPLEGAAIRLSGTQNRLTITDAQGNYHFDNVETNGLYQVTPSRPNFVFGPSQRTFSGLGQHTEATFNATPTGGTLNPLDTTEYFVRQQYVDFLGREPDEAGFNFWVNNIQSCGADAQCTGAKRIDTSAAFFLSIEFQQTGYLVYRMYQAAYGEIPGTPAPVRLSDFKSDTQEIGNGVIVNQDGWQTALEINKQAFATEFVQRGLFISAYPTTMSPTQLVNKLFANAGVTPNDTERTVAINEFGGAANTADTSARARALRRVAENSRLVQQEFDPAFVLMEYFGYLRRDPNSGPDPNFDGYDFWLAKLNQFNGDFEKADMVKAFLTATEYRQRFPR